MPRRLRVQVSDTTDEGGGRVLVFVKYTLTRDTGEVRTWASILLFDFQVAMVSVDVGPDHAIPDGEQLWAIKQSLVDIGTGLKSLHDYDARDTKFSLN